MDNQSGQPMTPKAYKGFDKDLKCRGFQYEIGGEYKTDEAECCSKGFHACEAPLDVLAYYPPANSRYCEVEQSGTFSRQSGDSDTKVASTEIKIGAEIGIWGLAKAHIEWVRNQTTEEHTGGDGGAATAGYGGAATAGDRGAATAGNRGAATAGNRGAATAGYGGAATAGNGGAATAGNRGAATAGDRGAATAGDRGAATAGYGGAANSRGKSSVGENGCASARGNNIKVKGGIGAILVLAEEREDSYDIRHWKAFIVDDETYKPDVWYKLSEDGEIIEASDEESD